MSRPASEQRVASHGRGGAGNLGARSESGTRAADLETPTIKSNTYTTGRGGAGNMAANNKDDPSIARAAQDVTTPVAHNKEAHGTFHWGRGGEGNMVTVGEGDRKRSSKTEERRPSFAGVIEKGKELLGLHKKKEPASKASESAIAD